MRISFLFLTIFWLSTSLVGQTYLFADFEQGIPSDWTAEACWIVGDSSSISSKNFKFGNHTNFVAVNDDAHENSFSKGGLVTNEIDLTNAKNVVFSMDFFFLAAEDEIFNILIQNGNSEWEQLSSGFTSCPCWRKLYFNLSKYVGSKIKIKFDYSDGGIWNYGVGLDDVIVREAKETEGFFYQIEPISKRISNPYNINYKIGFCSIGSKPLENVRIKLEGNNYKDSQSIDHMIFFDSTEIVINNLEIASYELTPSIVKNEMKLIGSPSFQFKLFPSIPQFVVKDIDGNTFNLHGKIANNHKVLLYFTTSWCADCKNNIPKLNDIKDEFSDVEVVAIYLDTSATEENLKNLNFGENFPSIAYSIEGFKEYLLFSQGFERSVPFSVLICPNAHEPEWSEVTWSSNSWDPGTVNAIKSNLRNCTQVTSSDDIFENEIIVFPNPSDGIVYIDYTDIDPEKDLEVLDILGKSISVRKSFLDNQIKVDFQQLKGLFFLRIKVDNQIITRKVEIF